jgi:hypothetical protein
MSDTPKLAEAADSGLRLTPCSRRWFLKSLAALSLGTVYVAAASRAEEPSDKLCGFRVEDLSGSSWWVASWPAGKSMSHGTRDMLRSSLKRGWRITDRYYSSANANVDLPDTAAQDSASKSNNPAVSG